MSESKDGGAALREALSNERDMDCYLEARLGNEVIADIRSVMAPTLTLRDYFAAAVLPALVEKGLFLEPTTAAENAYAVADAMIAARLLDAASSEARG